MDTFMSQNIVSMTFFNDYCGKNLFFTWKSMRFHSMDCLFSIKV